jgi:hypothetical protein
VRQSHDFRLYHLELSILVGPICCSELHWLKIELLSHDIDGYSQGFSDQSEPHQSATWQKKAEIIEPQTLEDSSLQYFILLLLVQCTRVLRLLPQHIEWWNM